MIRMKQYDDYLAFLDAVEILFAFVEDDLNFPGRSQEDTLAVLEQRLQTQLPAWSRADELYEAYMNLGWARQQKKMRGFLRLMVLFNVTRFTPL